MTAAPTVLFSPTAPTAPTAPSAPSEGGARIERAAREAACRRRRLVAWLAATAVALLAAPQARAADPVAKQLKALSKDAVKEVRIAASASRKALRSELLAIAGDYAGGAITAAAALEQGVDAATRAAAMLSTTALAAVTTVRDEVSLVLAAERAPGDELDEALGLDLMAGGRGEWDRFIELVGGALDDFDDDASGELQRFSVSLEVEAGKDGKLLDVHVRVRGLDERFGSVPSPSLRELIGKGTASPQIYIAATIVETSGSPSSTVGGLGFGLDDVDLVYEWSDGGGTTPTDDVPVDGDGVFTDTLDLVSTTGGPFAIELFVDALEERTDRTVMSRPSLVTADNQQAKIVVNEQRQQIKQAGKFFKQSTAFSNRFLREQINAVLKDHKQEMLTTEQAVDSVLGQLRFARGMSNLARGSALQTPLDAALLALQAHSIPDEQIPDDVLADGMGIYAWHAYKVETVFEQRNDQYSRTASRGLDRLVKQAAKQDEVLGVSYVLGSTRRGEAPLVSTVGAPVIGLAFRPHITDGAITVAIDPVVTVTGHLIGLVPALDIPTVETTVTTVPGGTVVLGGLVPQFDGTFTRKVPALATIPLLGHLFGAGESADRQDSLLFLVTPEVIDAE